MAEDYYLSIHDKPRYGQNIFYCDLWPVAINHISEWKTEDVIIEDKALLETLTQLHNEGFQMEALCKVEYDLLRKRLIVISWSKTVTLQIKKPNPDWLNKK